jgi:hypothetical protein
MKCSSLVVHLAQTRVITMDQNANAKVDVLLDASAEMERSETETYNVSNQKIVEKEHVGGMRYIHHVPAKQLVAIPIQSVKGNASKAVSVKAVM